MLKETKTRALNKLQELAPEIEFISYIFKKRLESESVGGECTYPPDLYKFIKEADVRDVSVDIDTNKFDDVINLLEKISQLNIGLVPTIRYKSIEHYNSVQEAKKATPPLPKPPAELEERKRAKLKRLAQIKKAGQTGKYPEAPEGEGPPLGDQATPSPYKPLPNNTDIQIYIAKRDADIAEMERLSAPAEAQPIYATPWAHLAAGTPDAPTAVPAADPAHVDLELENKVNAWHDQVAKEVEKPDGKGPIFEAPGRNVITAHQIPEDDKLPPGWEVRYDKRKDNKPYYVNHNTRTTQWDRPVVVTEPERPQLQFEPSSHEPDFSEEQVVDMLAKQLTAIGVIPEGQTWLENLDILFGLYRDTFEQARSLGEHLGIMVDLFLRQRKSASAPIPNLPEPTLDDIAASVSAPSPKRRPVPAPRPRHTFNKHKSAPETITPADVTEGDGERIVSILLPGN